MSDKTKDLMYYIFASLFIVVVLVSAVFEAIGQPQLWLSILTAVLTVAFVVITTIFRFKK